MAYASPTYKPSDESIYIWRARVLEEELKLLGIAVEVPNVNISAAVSPITRPTERIIPDKIPGMAMGKTTTNIVRSFPAPKA